MGNGVSRRVIPPTKTCTHFMLFFRCFSSLPDYMIKFYTQPSLLPSHSLSLSFHTGTLTDAFTPGPRSILHGNSLCPSPPESCFYWNDSQIILLLPILVHVVLFTFFFFPSIPYAHSSPSLTVSHVNGQR